MDMRTPMPLLLTPPKVKHSETKVKRVAAFSADSAGMELRPSGPICRDGLNGEYRVVRYARRCGVVSIVNGEVGALVYDRNDHDNDLEATHSRAMDTCRQWIADHPEEVLARAKGVHAKMLASG